MDIRVLKQIGLTDSEIKVYLALLDLGDSTRGSIVEKSGISGSKVYDVLEKLQTKGLVAIYTKNKVKHFKPTNPKQILYYLEDKRAEIRDIEDEAKEILPKLLAQFKASKEEHEVELLIGLKGLEVIFREQIEIMKAGEINYVIGGTRGSEEEAVVAFFQKIHLLREKKKIKSKMLYNLRQRENTEKFFGTKLYPHSTTKYIKHSSPVSINIYKDRVVSIVFGKTVTAVHIKSKDIANSFLEYFNILWKTAK
jgi:sugar-specific transcriptional regulator TrmB